MRVGFNDPIQKLGKKNAYGIFRVYASIGTTLLGLQNLPCLARYSLLSFHFLHCHIPYLSVIPFCCTTSTIIIYSLLFIYCDFIQLDATDQTRRLCDSKVF
jgi:hypothetical protein